MAVDDARRQREAKLQGLNQDVLAVKQTSPAAPVAGSSQMATGHAPAGKSAVLPLGVGLAALTLGVVSLLVAVYTFRVSQQQQATVMAAHAQSVDTASRLAQQDVKLADALQQVAVIQQQLENLLTAPPAAPASSTNATVANAQVNARLRKMELELEKMTAQLKQATDSIAQHQQFRQQLAGQGERLAAIARQTSETRQLLDGMDQQAALKEMQTRLDRAATDIRSLYRMLELGR